MSLKPSDNMIIPADTVRVARAIYPRGDNLCIKMRDELGPIFDDEQYRELFGQRGKPAESPGRLSLVTLFQSRFHLGYASGPLSWLSQSPFSAFDDGCLHQLASHN